MEGTFVSQYGELVQWHWWFRGRKRIIESTLSQELPGGRSLAIASVGCGPPEGLKWLVPLSGQGGQVVGLDADAGHLNGNGSVPGVEYVVGRLEEAPLPAGSFDLVLALDVLEHLDDDAAGLSGAFRLLKPGGLLLVTVPALPSLWGRQDVVSHHRRRYTRRTLLDAFARAGLPRPRATYFNTLLFPLVAAARWARAAVGAASESGSDFEENRPGMLNEALASLFAFERHLLWRVPMPVGVSLLALARAPRR